MKARFGSRAKAVVLVVLVMALVPAAVALAISGTYNGTTSQGKKCGKNAKSKCIVRIHVVKGVLQKDSTIFWHTSCPGKHWVDGGTGFTGPLKKGNKWHSTGTYTQSGLGNGIYARDTVKLSFTVKAHKAPGSVDVSAVVHDATGAVITHCKSPHVTFTAHK